MNTTRVWVIVSSALIVAVLVGGFLLGTQPLLAAAATSALSTASAQSRNTLLEAKLTALSRTAAKKDALQAQDAVLQKAVPTILKPNTFNRRVTEVAAIAGVRVKDVTLGAAVAYTVPQSLAAPAPAPAATPGATATPAAVAAPAAAAAPALAETDSLITAADFSEVPVTLTVDGTQAAVLAFSTSIQNDERVFAINSVATAVNDDGSTTATLSGYIYTLSR